MPILPIHYYLWSASWKKCPFYQLVHTHLGRKMSSNLLEQKDQKKLEMQYQVVSILQLVVQILNIHHSSFPNIFSGQIDPQWHLALSVHSYRFINLFNLIVLIPFILLLLDYWVFPYILSSFQTISINPYSLNHLTRNWHNTSAFNLLLKHSLPFSLFKIVKYSWYAYLAWGRWIQFHKMKQWGVTILQKIKFFEITSPRSLLTPHSYLLNILYKTQYSANIISVLFYSLMNKI